MGFIPVALCHLNSDGAKTHRYLTITHYLQSIFFNRFFNPSKTVVQFCSECSAAC